ncbi:MAG: hypothetical protein MJ089_05530, partial [Ruminococcus sp.]|nr:hypothetical protein [Ruminococcus sp.]
MTNEPSDENIRESNNKIRKEQRAKYFFNPSKNKRKRRIRDYEPEEEFDEYSEDSLIVQSEPDVFKELVHTDSRTIDDELDDFVFEPTKSKKNKWFKTKEEEDELYTGDIIVYSVNDQYHKLVPKMETANNTNEADEYIYEPSAKERKKPAKKSKDEPNPPTDDILVFPQSDRHRKPVPKMETANNTNEADEYIYEPSAKERKKPAKKSKDEPNPP